MRNIMGITFKADADNISNLIKSAEEFKAVHLIKVRNEYLKNQSDQCLKVNSNYIAKLTEEQTNAQIEWIIGRKITFNELKNEVEKYIQSSSKDLINIVRFTPVTAATRLRLQRVNLPHFDGNIKQYPCFKSHFTRQVLQEIKSTDPAPYALKSCLSGTAFDLINNTTDGLEEMLRRLDEINGKISKLTCVIINSIKGFLPIIESNYKQITEFVNLLEKRYHDLGRINMEREISNSHSVSLIQEKLPELIA